MILDILKEIAGTDSTNQKLGILTREKDNELLKRVFRMAYHPQLQYGIKKIPFYDKGDLVNTDLRTALNFLELGLATRNYTGNKAIDVLSDFLSGMTEDDAKVITLVIKRDLDCGASSTLANKVWKGLIPKQPQMLASAMSEKALKEIVFPAFAQLKADGARCFAEMRGDSVEDVKLFSRAGNEYLGLDLIKRELINRTKEYRQLHPDGVMVDGELVYTSRTKKNDDVSLDWMFGEVEEVEETKTDQKDVVLRSESNGIANKSLKGTISREEAGSMSFQVWDLVPLDCVYSEGKKKSDSYDIRFKKLSELFDDSVRILIIENTLVNDIDEARSIYKSYVEQGLEGIILKNIESIWENKRSKNLVKFKEEIYIDLRIVGILEHRKDESKLGAVLLKSDDGLIQVKCGSGFTDTNEVKIKKEWIEIPYEELDELNRKKLMLDQDEIIGKIMEIKCNGWISSEGRKDSVSLFLPVVSKFRHDKDETNLLSDVFPDAYEYLENL